MVESGSAFNGQKKNKGRTSSQNQQSEKGACIFLVSPFFCPIYRLQPVYINASPLTTDRNMTASSFSILLLPALLLNVIHLSAWCLTYMADRLGNPVDMIIPSTPEAHSAELASFGYVLWIFVRKAFWLLSSGSTPSQYPVYSGGKEEAWKGGRICQAAYSNIWL